MKQAVSSCLQTLDNDFFHAKIQALVTLWDKYLNVNTNQVEGSHVPSSTYMLHIHRSKNEVFASKVCATFFFKVLCI